MKIYRVGGAVRDRLLGLKSNDSDWVVVGATHHKMKTLGFILVGNQFPVYLHPDTKEEYALARREKKVSKGYNGFEFNIDQISLFEDLARRDLTINSIAEDENGDLIDPFNGQKDLELKILRHTTEAFKEDPLRVLRIARFRATLPDNFIIAPETKKLISEIVDSGELKSLTRERVNLELKKVSDKGNVFIFFETLFELNVMSEIFPYISEHDLYYFSKINKWSFDEVIAILSINISPDLLKNKLSLTNYIVHFSHVFRTVFIGLVKNKKNINIIEIYKFIRDKDDLYLALNLLKKIEPNLNKLADVVFEIYSSYLIIKHAIWLQDNILKNEKNNRILSQTMEIFNKKYKNNINMENEIKMKLFGTDGIRGKAGKFLTASMALKIAMAAGIFFKRERKTGKILLGKDTRLSGYMIEDAIVSGLTAVGYDVMQIGPMPTPAIAFLTEDMRCDAGIMISASHNHFSDNGIKFFDSMGNKLSEELEREIEKIYFDDELIENSQQVDQKIGSSKRIDDVIGRYIVHLKHSFPKMISLRGLRVVLDAANGAGYKVGPTVLEELGAEVITINKSPNGSNINDNCGAIHPQQLAIEVKKYRADIGLALDGDADRVVIVDERGETVHGDHLIGALSKYLFDEKMLSSNCIVATLMSNSALEDYLKNMGLKLNRSNVGDKYVLDMMQKENCNFGGEQSGHIIVSDFAKTGDGLLTGLQILAYLIKTGEKASSLLRPFKLYPQLNENIKIAKKIPLDKIDGFNNLISKVESYKIRHLVRYSGTENLLRILLEGPDLSILELEMEELKTFLQNSLG